MDDWNTKKLSEQTQSRIIFFQNLFLLRMKWLNYELSTSRIYLLEISHMPLWNFHPHTSQLKYSSVH